jgi:hypothetical protein
MCNDQTHRSSVRARHVLAFGVDPDWYQTYWLEPRRPHPHRRVKALLGFVNAIITTAMRLPADIKRAAGPCSRGGQ